MRGLVTHGGKIGDALWALAAIKALAVKWSEPVDMVVSTYLRPLVPLINAQEYIHKCIVDEAWEVEFTSPITPQIPPTHYDHDLIWDASMDGWPIGTIMEDHVRRAGVGLEPWEPWLKPLSEHSTGFAKEHIAICLTDEHKETKAGILVALLKAFPEQRFLFLTYPEARLAQEFTFPFRNLQTVYTSVSGLSDWLVGCKLVITCKSMARVMARGLGLKTAVIEPSVPRQNPVFDMPNENMALEQIINDFDSKACVELVRKML